MMLLTLKQKLNEGTFGEVFTTNNKHLIVKKIKDKDEGTNEITILNYLHSRESYSRYIIRIVESFYDKNDFLNIVFPRFEMNLYDVVYNKEYKNTNLDFRKHVALQIIQGVTFLHENQIIHRDIKLCNILFNWRNGLINIADFDWACIIRDKYEKRETGAITLTYKCPELIFYDKIMNEEFVYYSYEVDIFSLGVVLFEVYFSKSPFQYRKGMNHVDFLYEILQAWNPFYDFDSEIKLDFDLLLDSEFNTLNNFWKYNTTIPFHEYTQDLGIISCMCFPNPKLRLNIQDVKKFLYL